MADATVLERIDAWQAAGLIDEPTATRLRDAESHASDDGAAPRRRGFPLAAVFGPAVSVGEVFGYLGSAFLLAAWLTLSATGSNETAGLLVAGVVLAIIGSVVRSGSARMGRAGGVAFLVAGELLGAGVFLLLDGPTTSGATPFLGGAATWLIAAIGFRRVHRALLTQIGLIGAILTSAAAIMDALEDVIFGTPTFDPAVAASPVRVVLLAIGWGIAAVVLGVLGLREARGTDAAAGARAAITRLAAGLTAVLGTATAVFASGSLGNGNYGRLIEPAIGDALLIVVSAVLLERAFRRQASAFVYPAALGVIIGLSDLNASYFAEATSPQLALLVEGVILLAAGLAFDRLRKRVGGLGDPDDEAAPDASPAESGAA